MAQHDLVISDQNGLSFLADLNAALAAIGSSNSGGVEPPTPQPYMPWADAASGVLKIRNATNDAWIPLLSLTDGLPVNLGVGSVVQAYDADTAKLDVAQTFTAVQTMTPTTASSSSYTWAVNTDPNLTLTTTGNLTLNAPTGLTTGAFYYLEIVYGGTHTVTWNANFKGVTGIALTSTNAARDAFMFRAQSASVLELVGTRLNVGA